MKEIWPCRKHGGSDLLTLTLCVKKNHTKILDNICKKKKLSVIPLRIKHKQEKHEFKKLHK